MNRIAGPSYKRKDNGYTYAKAYEYLLLTDKRSAADPKARANEAYE
jgi:hypothetical protein